MKIFGKDQEIAFDNSFNDAVLSYEYEQAGFTINLMQRSVLLFNHNIKTNVTAKQLRKNKIKKNVMSSTLRKNMNSTFIYPYSNIREINYSLPDCKNSHAEICIMTDDVLNPVWTFRVPSDAHYICEQCVEVFNNRILFGP
ncbi:hypothetical protein JP88_004680 [Salmonella enterica subsp. enterica]|nr:hypothetical protein [Salmonella enterica]EDW0613220.1 hypothetical protein [Salmonella enterica subsp. enterica serovar Ball]